MTKKPVRDRSKLMRVSKFIWTLIQPAVEGIAWIILILYVDSMLMFGFPGIWAFDTGHWILGALYFLPVAGLAMGAFTARVLDSWKVV